MEKKKGKKMQLPAPTDNGLFLDNLDTKLANSIQSAILGFDPQSIGVQLSQVDTIFINLRWYLISNMRQPLSEAYAELGLVQTICDVPVQDAFRGGIEIITSELDPDEIKKLGALMKRQGDVQHLAQANIWNRLYGGAGVLICTGQDWDQPLDIASIDPDDPLEFRPVDMWELFFDLQNIMGDGTPVDNELFEWYNYYGKQVHKSRVLPLRGIQAPSFIRPRLRGWGMSYIEKLVRSINQYLKATDLSFEVLDEFKLDIFKIKGLTNLLLSSQGEAKVRNRVQMANAQKNFQNALTMDAEDDYMQKQLSFSGLAETMQGIRIQVASDMRMPLTKLFGLSAQGFNSGEDDIENYNAMIEADIRAKSEFHLIRMIELRCQQLFGMVPEDLEIKFAPLRIMSSEQQETVKSSQFNRLLAARQAGEIDRAQFLDGCNKDNLLGIQIETAKLGEQELDTPEEPEAEGEEKTEEDLQKSGAENVTAPKSTKEAKTAKEAPA